jgi:hypothetical protein
MWRTGRAPNNTSKWQMLFNFTFKGLKDLTTVCVNTYKEYSLMTDEKLVLAFSISFLNNYENNQKMHYID